MHWQKNWEAISPIWMALFALVLVLCLIWLLSQIPFGCDVGVDMP